MDLAVIKTGGKQYVVSKGTVLNIEKLKDAKVGDAVSFDEVLMTATGTTVDVGAPTVKASVKGKVMMLGRNKKIDVVKYKAKSRYLKRRGHKQPFVKVKIESL